MEVGRPRVIDVQVDAPRCSVRAHACLDEEFAVRPRERRRVDGRRRRMTDESPPDVAPVLARIDFDAAGAVGGGKAHSGLAVAGCPGPAGRGGVAVVEVFDELAGWFGLQSAAAGQAQQGQAALAYAALHHRNIHAISGIPRQAAGTSYNAAPQSRMQRSNTDTLRVRINRTSVR